MDRIAVISDIHGNLTALQTVLSDIQERGISTIWCLGDIRGKGKHSDECLALTEKNCEIRILGNHEEFKEPVLDFPFCHEVMISGRLVRLFHSHPTKTNQMMFGAFFPPDQLYSWFLPSERTISQKTADVVVFGHIHTPFMTKCFHRMLINAGSVGNGIEAAWDEEKNGNVKETTAATYVILSGVKDSENWDEPFSVEFVSLPYDIEKELEGTDDEALRLELTKGWYRDQEKLQKYLEKAKKMLGGKKNG